jgi:DNA polymerase-3 subunit delta'
MQILLQQTQAYHLLKKESEENILSHAYLLLWEDPKLLRKGIKEFAKLLFLKNGKEDARISKLIDEESFSDCIFSPEEGKKLTVEDVEKIKEESELSPIEGDKKVFVLADFSYANDKAQNKLLKLLEEPPKGVYFLLGASSVFAILQTVLSRTKKLEIQPFSIEQIKFFLRRNHSDAEERKLLFAAVASGGQPGEAESALHSEEHAKLLECAFELALTPIKRIPALIKNVGESKKQKELLSMLRLVYRDAALLKIGRKEILLQTETGRLQEVANAYSIASLIQAQDCIKEAEKEITFNAVFAQCMEICIQKIREIKG